jgi:hypothetical protein
MREQQRLEAASEGELDAALNTILPHDAKRIPEAARGLRRQKVRRNEPRAEIHLFGEAPHLHRHVRVRVS